MWRRGSRPRALPGEKPGTLANGALAPLEFACAERLARVEAAHLMRVRARVRVRVRVKGRGRVKVEGEDEGEGGGDGEGFGEGFGFGQG